MGPGDLEEILRKLPEERAPELISSIHDGEDVAVYLLDRETAIVQTVDFFPPVVDDPYTFGQVAAANALSDIYAMNAVPLTALNIAAWPCGLGKEVLAEVLLGGCDKVHEAGAVVAGGHTIEDDEPKYGLSVMGKVRVSDMIAISGAVPGDLLVLTKPVGTGVMTTARKAGLITEEELRPVVDSMCALNGPASAVLARHNPSAMTDVTGFGLAGHLFEMVRASGVGARVWASEVPLFPGTLEMVAIGMAARNCAEEFVQAKRVELADANLDPLLVQCIFDPQTSGGLLASVPAAEAGLILDELRDGPAEGAAIVGLITEAPEPKVSILHSKGNS